MGPTALRETIKIIGTSGGDPFNANPTHPYENPNVLTNFVQILCIFVIPAAPYFTFGDMMGNSRRDQAMPAAMIVLFVVLAIFLAWTELHASPMPANLGIDQTVSNMEGKEIHFGIVVSSLLVTITTAASCGMVNATHGSLAALGGFVSMSLMQLGEVMLSGMDLGLYGMLVYVILAAFVTDLMTGRTSEYLNKKIEVFEMGMTSITIPVTPLLVLIGTAVAVVVAQGKTGIFSSGTYGFSEMLYAFLSAANNSDSAFADLSASTPFYNVALGIYMWLDHFWIIMPVLAMADTFAAKKRLPVTADTLPTHGPLLVALLISLVLLVGALTYIPTLALGPIAEHLAR